MKQNRPILVILGNPPYNGFAGMAVDEERELSEAYRTTKRVRRPEGQGLNDLYVRFFRMAERRIAEKTGQGVVCLISNYSWLDGLSFTGMRERYLEAFDAVRIDCLNGDKYKTGKVAPDGSPDPSIFSTESDPVGIQVGTAIATLVRKAEHRPAEGVEFRHLWGQAKSVDLIATAEVEPKSLYEGIEPVLPLGLPFAQTAANDEWFDWPTLPALFPGSFPGVKTSRDRFLLDVDVDRLRARIADYFDATLSHDDIARRFPGVMQTSGRYDARAVRDGLLNRGGPDEAGLGPISRRFRMQQYLGNRLAIDPELARSFPSAQTLTMTRQSHSSIKIHSVHPPPSIRSILTKAIDGPILVRRRNRTNRPLHWGIIAPPFSPVIIRKKTSGGGAFPARAGMNRVPKRVERVRSTARLKHGTFHSLVDLQAAINRFVQFAVIFGERFVNV